ncbi:MAG TPA: hypothetical protein PLE45_07815 [Spirochaetota bacterium]|nr:hypothetical protein [Spirochaetota bacterium]HPP04717.1 hypothetical protein [Spirochaetota bacterium]
MKKYLFFFFILFPIIIYSEEWIFLKSKDYLRITDSFVRDLDNDGIDEIIIASFTYSGKRVDIYKIVKNDLVLVDEIDVPKRTIFYDVGDIDNNKIMDIAFLASDGLYYKSINLTKENQKLKLNYIPNIFSEIVVPQPELLKSVPMIIDLNGDGFNELIIENVRSIEIFDTKNFTKVAAIDLETILEFALIPGQFYPHYIFYTLPIIQIKDLDNDNKKEIITKFPRSINIFGINKGLDNWQLKRKIYIGKDNVYFLSNSFVKFSFPVITDIDNDGIKEIIISSANLDMPRIRFEAVGDVYYFSKWNFNINESKQIVIKGIPLNLPYFFNISNDKYKDFICPSIPFNLLTIFTILSGRGNVNVPFMYYQQDKDKFDIKNAKKLFEIPFRIEHITSFVEELPFDQYKENFFPDFYYFLFNPKEKTVDIIYYYYDKNKYQSETVKVLSVPDYSSELPGCLKLGKFRNSSKKDVLFVIHKNFFVVKRKD